LQKIKIILCVILSVKSENFFFYLITMNLMFRKNFREGGNSSGANKSMKMTKINRGGKRSRDMSVSSPSDDSFGTQYRTHLFFNARTGYGDYNDGGLMNFLFILSSFELSNTIL
jgi:hypothetical protein